MTELTAEQICEMSMHLMADSVHEIWATWMGSVLGRSPKNKDGTFTIPKELASKWEMQMGTEYADLPEEEQGKDIEVVKIILERQEGIAHLVSTKTMEAESLKVEEE